MVNHLEQTKEILGIDCINEYFMNTDNIFFYLEDKKESSICDELIHVVYSSEDIVCSTLKDYINMLDKKSELCEIVGVNALLTNIYNKIERLDQMADITVPIIYNRNNCFLEIGLRRSSLKNIVIGRLQFINSNNSEILYASSYKDNLTGLFNRNALKNHIALMKDNDLYVALIDIDNFKTVNDRYGHAQGDALLKAVGKMLIRLSDKNMIAYRIGGDEFFLQFFKIDQEDVRKKLQDINSEVHEICCGEYRASCSIGATKVTAEVLEEKENVLWLADIALYECKKRGKDSFYFLSEHDIRRCLDNKKR